MLQQPDRSDKASGLPPETLPVYALAGAANAILITDESTRIVWVNQAFSRLCGYAPTELLGKTPAMLNSGMQSKSFYALLWQTLLSGNAWRGIITDRRKDGSLYTVDETITPLMNEHGLITHYIAIQQDMTLRGPEQEKDRFLAYHDMVTGLPNRGHFDETLKQALLLGAQTKDMLAVMFLDLDKFKPVNDLFGHATGDRLLQAVGDRLQAAVRKSDTVARFGGDEFAILLQGVHGKDIVTALATKLVHAIEQPFVIGDHKLQIGVSIGIAMYPVDSQRQVELTNMADEAMYAVKQSGGSGYRFYGARDAGTIR
jgi:diguanylate cyclase (GGDEF)-like protein/PAS domain S-box-containing protein